MNDDEEPTPEELHDAAALARALDAKGGDEPGGGANANAVPADVMPVAALLVHARGGGGLDPARAKAIRERVRPNMVRPRPARARWWLWLIPPAAAMVTAGVLLAPMRRQSPGTSPGSLATLAPSRALLAAQADAVRRGPAALADLDRQMRGYRRLVLRGARGETQ